MEQHLQPQNYEFVINVLVGVIGILVGVGLSHIGILRKLNSLVVSVARNEERTTTLFTFNSERKQENDRTMAMHQELLSTMRELITAEKAKE